MPTLVRHMYDMYVILPERAYAWKQEVIGFIENYEFPSNAAWDRFHVYFGTKLKLTIHLRKRIRFQMWGWCPKRNVF